MRAIAAVFIFGVVSAAAAHEFWIEPSSFRPSASSIVQIDLRVGDGFPGEALQRSAEKIDRFFAVVNGEQRDIIGKDGSQPAGLFKTDQPGPVTLAYRSKHSHIELPAEKFESYLKEEGLDGIIAKRAQRGESAKPGREAYSRCAKSIINIDGASGKVGRSVDFPLEILMDADPASLKAGDEVVVRLLLNGKPLEGILTRATHKSNTAVAASGRTDKEGQVRLKLGADGMWMIHCVHMREAPAGLDADWESLWGSLTFQVGASEAANPVKR
ncbi:MAG: DUF4198 domain-containing protein [Phycisphaerales bacterium]|nr:DUF4198 domain-containing protein [Phycisphaerales bacterium]